MQKISELKREHLIYNHIVYNNELERHFAKHSHALVELIYVLKGEVSYTIEDKKFTARPGNLIVIQPYAYHYFSIINQQDYEKIGVLFHTSDVCADGVISDPFLLLSGENERIHDIFNKVDFYFHNCPTDVFIELLYALTREVLVNIELFRDRDVITSHKQLHPFIERTLNYINDNLFTVNTVTELARETSVSVGYLKALFTRHLKISPKKYITEKKMLMAKNMIIEGTPPTQAAFQCGFSNYATFYRLYQKQFSKKPTDDFKKMPNR